MARETINIGAAPGDGTGDPARTAFGKVNDGFAAAGRMARQRAALPLVLPTNDGNPSVGHPDVVFVPEGWNGYRYWMAYTPFPSDTREDIYIVASDDGVTWETPAGLANPIHSLANAQALNHWHNSDPDLVLLANGTMACYHRPARATANESIYRQTSTDGVTWSAAVLVMNNPTTNTNRFLSPAVVQMADGSFRMWSVNELTAGSAYTMEVRTSADGLTFGAPSTCTLPAGVTPWHVDVVRVGDTYHALLNDRSTSFRLRYLTSTDGLTWAGPTQPIPLTGFPFDNAAHYRGSLIPVPGHPLAFDIWFTGIDNSNANIFLSVWRVGLLRGYDPSTQAFGRTDARYPQISRLSHYLPANVLRAAGVGSPTELIQSFRFPAWSLPDGALVAVTTSFIIPESWRFGTAWPRIKISLIWTQDATDTPTGDVVLFMLHGRATLGSGLTTDPSTSTTKVTAPAPTRRAIQRTELLASTSVEPSSIYVVSPRRAGADAPDTFTGAVILIGVLIEAMET